MATIALLTQKTDGNLEGTLTTLNITAPIALLPNTRKSRDSAPDYLVVSRKNGFERRRLEPDFEEHRRGIHRKRHGDPTYQIARRPIAS